MRRKYDYVIYHKNCIDGFSSYFILTHTGLIDEHAKIYPDQPSAKDIPRGIENKNVIIMDVAYKKDILEQIIKKAKYVTHIDHHVTTKNSIENLLVKYKEKLNFIYNKDECGATLTWLFFRKYLTDMQTMPLFLKYIKDNDIGAWKHANTRPFITALSVYYDINNDPHTLGRWDNLLDESEIKRLINMGNIFGEYEEYLLEINSKRYSIEAFPSKLVYENNKQHFTKAGQYKVAVINGSGCPSGSMLGKKIVESINCDFCILWTLNMYTKEYVLSFRSKSVDVEKIASAFGGGGHIYAAACSIPESTYNILDLFFNVSLPRNIS